MPSPFPGMDPYLEDPGLWPDVHLNLISSIQEILGERLAPKYLLRVEDRVYISDEYDPGRRLIVPDVQIIAAGGFEGPFSGGGAALDVAEPIAMTTIVEDEIREPRLRIIDRQTRDVVTVIEVLSPTNKASGARGRQNYESKREEILSTSTHLVEIDLLRKGDRIFTREMLPPCEYLVHVSEKSRRPTGWIWPIRLSQHLPAVRIPLRPDDTDAFLDLQGVLNAAYQRARYALEVDYRKPPTPPLEGEWAEWADRLLREKGLR